jgi:hypothetical protein
MAVRARRKGCASATPTASRPLVRPTRSMRSQSAASSAGSVRRASGERVRGGRGRAPGREPASAGGRRGTFDATCGQWHTTTPPPRQLQCQSQCRSQCHLQCQTHCAGREPRPSPAASCRHQRSNWSGLGLLSRKPEQQRDHTISARLGASNRTIRAGDREAASAGEGRKRDRDGSDRPGPSGERANETGKSGTGKGCGSHGITIRMGSDKKRGFELANTCSVRKLKIEYLFGYGLIRVNRRLPATQPRRPRCAAP